MADIKTKEERSHNMSAIKGKDTKPEMLVRRFLHAAGYRYRLHKRNLPGCPDIVFPSLHTVIFVHGCFWHGHQGCKYFQLPKSNEDFWRNKISRNIERDAQVQTELEKEDWNVITIWECDLKNKSRREATLGKVVQELFSIRNHTYSHPGHIFMEAAEPEIPYDIN
ncbi:MAG: very short patch repair endonuclease [Muribaculaceae bacterium]